MSKNSASEPGGVFLDVIGTKIFKLLLHAVHCHIHQSILVPPMVFLDLRLQKQQLKVGVGLAWFTLSLYFLAEYCTDSLHSKSFILHCKQFSIYVYSQKRFSQASLQISTKYFHNRIIMFCLELWYFVETNSTKCSHSAVSIGNNIFPNGIMKQ